MKRLLLDLNILLDVVLERPGAPAAARLWAALERGEGQGVIPAHGVTTVFYVVARAQGRAFAKRATEALLRAFAVAPTDEGVLRRALDLDWSDFEDAVCAAAAEASLCDAIVTRDVDGFCNAPIEVLDPTTALACLVERG